MSGRRSSDATWVAPPRQRVRASSVAHYPRIARHHRSDPNPHARRLKAYRSDLTVRRRNVQTFQRAPMSVPVPVLRDHRTGAAFRANLAANDRQKRIVQKYLEGLPLAQRLQVRFAIAQAMEKPIQVDASVARPAYSDWTDASGGVGQRPTTRDVGRADEELHRSRQD